MDKKETILKLLRNFKKRINKLYVPEKIIFFGSSATGKSRKDSDIDLIIVSKKFDGVSMLKRSPELYMKWDMDYPVDFLCYTPEEFEKKKKQVSIVRQAVKEGVEI
ncbi:MAG: nucleotidyltransferase domain-containing protein [archaeon]